MKVLAVLIIVLITACSGTQKTKPVPMNAPPENSDVVMPQSLPLIEEEKKSETVKQTDMSADLTRTEVETFLDRGPSFVLTLLDVAPETNGNSLVGFKIARIAPSAAPFLDGKLSVGDIVTHVNGVKVVKPDDLMTAWKSVRNADEVRVDYKRGDEVRNAIWTVQ